MVKCWDAMGWKRPTDHECLSIKQSWHCIQQKVRTHPSLPHCIPFTLPLLLLTLLPAVSAEGRQRWVVAVDCPPA